MQLRRCLLLIFLLLLMFPAIGLDVPTTRYVKSSCSNGISTYEPTGNTCTGGSSLVYSTIQNGINALVGSDTLDIRVGTYVEALTVSSTIAGVVGAPTTIQGHAGELVTIQPTSTNGANDTLWAYGSYFVFDNLTIDGTNLTTSPTNLVAWGLNDGVTVSHHITLQNSTIVNQKGSGSACLTSFGEQHTDMTYRNLIVHDCGTSVTVQNPGEHCIYIPGTRYTVENSLLYNCHTFGIQLYPNPSGNTIRYNVIHDTGAGGIISYDRTTKIYNNIIYTFWTDQTHYPSAASGGINQAAIKSMLAGTNYTLHNTIYSGTTGSIGIWTIFQSGAIVKNNVISTVTTGIQDDGTSNSYATNTCPATIGTKCTSGNPQFINASSADFNLNTTSNALNAGTDLTATCPSGMNCAFNGALPDNGALEAPTKNNFSVNGATVTFVWNNPFTPIVKVSNPTCRLGGVSDVVTSCTTPSAGSNTFACTLTTPAIVSDTVDCSVAAGAVASSVLVGNLAASTGRASNLALSNSAVTNLTTATAPTLTQTHQQFYQLVGGANIAVALLAFTGGTAEDSSAILPSPSAFRVRTAVEDTVAAASAGGLECWVSEGGGAYAQIPASTNGQCTGGAHLCMSPIPGLTNFAATTQRQTSSKTFVTGAVVQDQSSTPNVAWTFNSETEQECAVQIASGVSATTTFDFRMRRAGGAVLDAYSTTIRATVGGPFGLFMSGAK